jgi:hypothetical protein
VRVGHPNLKPAERCRQCQKGKLYPGEIQMSGANRRPTTIGATVYRFEELLQLMWRSLHSTRSGEPAHGEV